MQHIARGGNYLRVADPEWADPLSPEFSRERGGRWNPPGSFGVVYLNATRDVARALVAERLDLRGIRPEDLSQDAAPVLVRTRVPDKSYVDAVSDDGLSSLGLPTTYPLDSKGQPVGHKTCQPIGLEARNAGESGIACRSAVAIAKGGEELALFEGPALSVEQMEVFADWF